MHDDLPEAAMLCCWCLNLVCGLFTLLYPAYLFVCMVDDIHQMRAALDGLHEMAVVTFANQSRRA